MARKTEIGLLLLLLFLGEGVCGGRGGEQGESWGFKLNRTLETKVSGVLAVIVLSGKSFQSFLSVNTKLP